MLRMETSYCCRFCKSTWVSGEHDHLSVGPIEFHFTGSIPRARYPPAKVWILPGEAPINPLSLQRPTQDPRQRTEFPLGGLTRGKSLEQECAKMGSLDIATMCRRLSDIQGQGPSGQSKKSGSLVSMLSLG